MSEEGKEKKGRMTYSRTFLKLKVKNLHKDLSNEKIPRKANKRRLQLVSVQ